MDPWTRVNTLDTQTRAAIGLSIVSTVSGGILEKSHSECGGRHKRAALAPNLPLFICYFIFTPGHYGHYGQPNEFKASGVQGIYINLWTTLDTRAMNFIETSSGILLNASAILNLRPVDAKDPETDFYADTGNSRDYLVKSYSAPKPGQVIPNANPEIVVLTLWCNFDEAGAPEGTPTLNELPVVAWRVEASGDAHPLTPIWERLSDIGESGGQLYALMDRRSGHCWSNCHEQSWSSQESCLKSLAEYIRRAVMAQRRTQDALAASPPAG